MNALFTPTQIGRYTLRNRILMSALTRSRCDDETGEPNDLVVEYYTQRAAAGLIITEGVAPGPMGKGYVRTPGIYTDGQTEAWARVADAVHAQGGLIFMQLMHCGRISHPSMLPGGVEPIAPSAVKPTGQVFASNGLYDFVEPRALDLDEIPGVIAEYADATRRALAAGFDGVELHAASGYLPAQFLSSSTNLRTDGYGGSIDNRVRFIAEVIEAMVAEAGADRVGIKIAPEMPFNDVTDATPQETYAGLVRRIAPMRLAYLEVQLFGAEFDYHSLLKPLWPTAYLRGSGLTPESAEQLIANGLADATVFGTAFVSNPDLVKRIGANAAIAPADRKTYFSEGPEGYTDYPAMAG